MKTALKSLPFVLLAIAFVAYGQQVLNKSLMIWNSGLISNATNFWTANKADLKAAIPEIDEADTNRVARTGDQMSGGLWLSGNDFTIDPIYDEETGETIVGYETNIVKAGRLSLGGDAENDPVLIYGKSGSLFIGTGDQNNGEFGDDEHNWISISRDAIYSRIPLFADMAEFIRTVRVAGVATNLQSRILLGGLGNNDELYPWTAIYGNSNEIALGRGVSSDFAIPVESNKWMKVTADGVTAAKFTGSAEGLHSANASTFFGSGQVPISRLATGTPDGTKFLRDDGTLATPGGSSGFGVLVCQADSTVHALGVYKMGTNYLLSLVLTTNVVATNLPASIPVLAGDLTVHQLHVAKIGTNYLIGLTQ